MKKFEIFLIAIVIICIVPTVAAFEFDNVKNYDAGTKTVSIRNSVLGMEWWQLDKVADITLDTPLVYSVMPGKDRLVAEFTVNSYDDYNNALKSMQLYDNNQKQQEVSRLITYKKKEYYQIQKQLQSVLYK